MDREQAKKILALYRPEVPGDADPQLAEALELVQRDPELAAWYEQQSAVFNAIRGKLKSVPIPQGLRRQIIVEHVANTRVLPLTNRMLLTASIAALILLTAIVWIKLTAENPLNEYRDRVARMVQRGYFMKMHDKDLAKIRDYFGSEGAPVDYVLPSSLEKLPGRGGVVFPWKSHQVSLLCLNGAKKPGERNELYLFMVNRACLPEAPGPGKSPEFKTVSKLMTMTWTVGDKVYLLAGTGDEETLKQYLK